MVEKLLSFTLTPSGYTDTLNVSIEEDIVLDQMGHLATLTSSVATSMAKDHFNPEDLTKLYVRSLEHATYEDREDPEGQLLPTGLRATQRVKVEAGFPSTAHVAASSLGWFPTVAEVRDEFGVYLPNRAVRMAAEWMVRTLRSTARRFLITQALLEKPDSVAAALAYLEETFHIVVERAELKNRQKAIKNWVEKHGQAPTSMCSMEQPPQCKDILLAGATDRQWQRLGREGREVMWQFTLPTTVKPASRADYHHVNINLTIPAYVESDVPIHTPTVRIVPTKTGTLQILLDVSYSVDYVQPPTQKQRAHAPALGVDWGTVSALTAVVGHKSRTGKLVIDSHPVFFNTRAIVQKLKRLKKNQDAIMGKILLWKQLMVNCFNQHTLHQLEQLITDAEQERRLINEKRANVNQHLAHIGAIWLIRQALTVGAKTIYIENLRTLATDTWTPWSEVLTDAVRGKIFAYLQDWCDRLGIKLVEVQPAYTSVTCSKCTERTMEFYRHSDVKEKGHVWAHCLGCNYTAHRDYNAAVNILSRGLFGKTAKPFRAVSEFSKKFQSRRGRGLSHEGPTPRSRAKTGPTPKQNTTRSGLKKATLAKRAVRRHNSADRQGKNFTTVSRAYKHPSVWRLLGRNYSPSKGQVAQVEAGGMFPHVTPSHLHPLQV